MDKGDKEVESLLLTRINSDEPGPIEVEIRAVECPILLGRGPLLHIGDTKISRKQGQIEWSADNKWTLVTIRAMLFKKAGDEDNWDRLDGGTSVPLTEGCSIGFLDVQELTFKVSLKPTKVRTRDERQLFVLYP